MDYRALVPTDGRRYDRIVSCEMLEAVGHEFLGDYFHHCERLLAHDGVLVVQAREKTLPPDPKKPRKCPTMLGNSHLRSP